MVIQTNRKVVQIGNSLGIIIPYDDVDAEGITKGELVEVIIRRRSNAARQIPGNAAAEVLEYHHCDSSWDHSAFSIY